MFCLLTKEGTRALSHPIMINTDTFNECTGVKWAQMRNVESVTVNFHCSQGIMPKTQQGVLGKMTHYTDCQKAWRLRCWIPYGWLHGLIPGLAI